MNRIWFFIIIIAGMLTAGCGQDNKPAQTPPAQPAPATAAPPATVPAPAPGDKPSPPPSSSPTASSDTKSLPLPPPSPKPPPGSVAYVTQESAVLLEQPSENARKIPVRFKRSETIYILEPKMTDEKGREYDIPQWYKVQCENGQQGWMRARFVGQPF